MSEVLNLQYVDGKLYLNDTSWPELFRVERSFFNGVDKRLTAWDGQNFKLWLENGNAVYTLAPDDDGKGATLTLHRKVCSDLAPFPGAPPAPPTPALTKEAVEAAPERPRIVIPPSVLEHGIFRDDSSGYALQQLIQQGIAQPLSPMARALLAARDPKQAGGARSFTDNLGRSWTSGGDGGGGTLKIDAAHVNYGGAIYGIPVYQTFTQDAVSPGLLRSELALSQRRLRAEIEAKLAEMQMASFDAHVGVLGGAPPPSLAVATEAAAQKWRNFLVDVGEFLRVLDQTASFLTETNPSPTTELYFPDPMALRGRASDDNADSWERQPVQMPVRSFHSHVSATAAALRQRATDLSKLVSPEPKVDECPNGTLMADEHSLSSPGLSLSQEALIENYNLAGNGEMGGDE